MYAHLLTHNYRYCIHAAVECPLDHTVARATSNANAGNIDEFETNQLYASNSLIHKHHPKRQQ